MGTVLILNRLGSLLRNSVDMLIVRFDMTLIVLTGPVKHQNKQAWSDGPPQMFTGSILGSGNKVRKIDHEIISMAILSLPLIQVECNDQLLAKGCVLVNHLGSLPRKGVVKLTDCLDMTMVVDWDVKPLIKQTRNKHLKSKLTSLDVHTRFFSVNHKKWANMLLHSASFSLIKGQGAPKGHFNLHSVFKDGLAKGSYTFLYFKKASRSAHDSFW